MVDDSIFRKAAEKALLEWHKGQWDRQRDGLDELTQDLWVWYLESPSVQQKLQQSDPFLVLDLIHKAAIRRLAERALSSDVFEGKALYSGTSVQSALKGASSNKYLNRILPAALRNLDKKSPRYAEAIRSRYTDGLVPESRSKEQVLLSRAVESLTQEVNVIYLTTEPKGIGSSAAVFPESRKRKGEHSDPTGNIALTLIEHPEMREAFYEETPLPEFLAGRAGRC